MMSRSPHRIRAVVIVILGIAATVPSVAKTTESDPNFIQYARLVRASTLNEVGEPFRLRISFELHDLEGKVVEQGVAEESWDGKKGRRIAVDSPSFHLKLPEESEVAEKDALRESYLVREVLTSLVHPMEVSFDPANVNLDLSEQSFHGYRANCLSLLPAGGTAGDTTKTYCSDINGGLIAIRGGGGLTIRRDRFETYLDKQVPRVIEMSYADKLTITAKVLSLEAIESEGPAKTGTQSDRTFYGLDGEQSVGASTMQVLNHKNPSYPFEAKMKHLSGTVVVAAVIGKNGKITALDTVASPDRLLSKSAIDAVKHWTYAPYVVHGNATAVSTTIYVKYALGKQ